MPQAGKGVESNPGGSAPVPPSVAALPPPPTLAAPALPTGGGQPSASTTAASSSSPEHALLRTLVAHVATQENVPAEITQLLSHYQEETHKATGKALHKLVSRQQEARRGLSKTRADRQAYDTAWSAYLGHLAQLLEKQMTERSNAIQAFEQAEESWKTQLEDTTSELSRHAATQQSAIDAIDQETIDVDEEMDRQEQAISDAAQEEARATVRRDQQKEETEAKAKEMLQGLRQMQQSLDPGGRDGSRTPRRSASKDRQGEDADKAKAKDKADPGKAHV